MATTFQNVILVKYFAFYDGSNIVINNLEDDEAEYLNRIFQMKSLVLGDYMTCPKAALVSQSTLYTFPMSPQKMCQLKESAHAWYSEA